MYAVLLPHQEKGKKLKAMDVMQFPWEKEIEQKEVLPKTRQEMEAFWEERDKRKQQ